MEARKGDDKMNKREALLLFFLGNFVTDLFFLDTFERMQVNPDLSMVLSPVFTFIIWIFIYFGVLVPRIKRDEKVKPILV
jgi:hypothetical protein